VVYRVFIQKKPLWRQIASMNNAEYTEPTVARTTQFYSKTLISQ
jgi:hypothetical protein